MKKNIAINGFGRIGRLILRAYIENKLKNHDLFNFNIVAINDLTSPEMNAFLLKYDSVHGIWDAQVSYTENSIIINDIEIACFAIKDPELLPWGQLKIACVLECSGRFTDKTSANKHLSAGAKKVLVSAPCKNADLTIVYGVNHHLIARDMAIFSNASCTTNCLAPIAHVIHQNFEIVAGTMLTVHAYTGDQNLTDQTHSDKQRARAANLSMIPSTTGAASAVGLVIPELQGKLFGSSIRVPTANVSYLKFSFETKRKISVATINSVLSKACDNELKNIMAMNFLPLVSQDFNHQAYSSIVNGDETSIMHDNFGNVSAWYDNEWGFANRMLNTTSKIIFANK